MMTVREAHQRAAVHGVQILVQHKDKARWYGAAHPDWNRNNPLIRWREDVEDAALDCGRLRR